MAPSSKKPSDHIPHPLTYVTTDALVDELIARHDDVILVLYKNEKETENSLFWRMSGSYFPLMGLSQHIPEWIGQVFSDAITAEEEDEEWG